MRSDGTAAQGNEESGKVQAGSVRNHPGLVNETYPISTLSRAFNQIFRKFHLLEDAVTQGAIIGRQGEFQWRFSNGNPARRGISHGRPHG
jgi:hypothetical protein